MKRFAFGDILSVERGIIVHGCNAQGVMNSGLAQQIKARWPGCWMTYNAYLQERKDKDPADLLGHIVPYRVFDGPTIINAITQKDYGRDPNRRYVNYRAIRDAFNAVALAYSHRDLPINYPQIGAGLGNGDWGLISGIINAELRYCDHTLWIREE